MKMTTTRDTNEVKRQKGIHEWTTTKITVEIAGSVWTLTQKIHWTCAWCIPQSHVSGINHLIQLALSELAQEGPPGMVSFSGTTRANFERARQHLQAAFGDINGCWNDEEEHLVWLISREIEQFFTAIFQRLDVAESSSTKPTEPITAKL